MPEGAEIKEIVKAAVKEELSDPKKKPGFKTTEFWLTAIAEILGLLMASGFIAGGNKWAPIIGIAISALAAMGYTSNRSKIKVNQ